MKTHQSLVDDRNRAIEWSKQQRKHSDFWIFNTKGTGWKKNSRITEMAAVHYNNNLVLEAFIQDKQFTLKLSEDNSNSSNFVDFLTAYDFFSKKLSNQKILIFNAIDQLNRLNKQVFKNDRQPFPFDYECVQTRYSAFINNWNMSQARYEWQTLPFIDNTALDNCWSTIKVLDIMATTNDQSY